MQKRCGLFVDAKGLDLESDLDDTVAYREEKISDSKAREGDTLPLCISSISAGDTYLSGRTRWCMVTGIAWAEPHNANQLIVRLLNQYTHQKLQFRPKDIHGCCWY